MQETLIVEEFLNKYRELEDAVNMRYKVDREDDGSSIFILKKQYEFKPFINQINLCKETRNLLSHEPKIKGGYPVIPSKYLIKMVESLKDRVINPPKVGSIMVGIQNVCFAKPSDHVRPFLKKMIDNVYTHIPILEDGRVVGVFSENTLLSLLSKEDIIGIDDNDTFNGDILKNLIPTEKHSTESFRFVPRDTTIFEINQLFAKAVKDDDRIGLVFITQTGKSNERLLGIVSPWDIPRSERWATLID